MTRPAPGDCNCTGGPVHSDTCPAATHVADGATSTLQDVVRGLRAWAAHQDPHVRAAVDLLIEHDHWLRNGHFARACIQAADNDLYRISWLKARSVCDGNLIGSTSELAVLDFAIALGVDRYRFNIMGPVLSAMLLKATAQALGPVVTDDMFTAACKAFDDACGWYGPESQRTALRAALAAALAAQPAPDAPAPPDTTQEPRP